MGLEVSDSANRSELVGEHPQLDAEPRNVEPRNVEPVNGEAAGRTPPELRTTDFRTAVVVRSVAVVAAIGGLLFTAYWRLGTAAIIYDEPTYANAGWAYVHGSFVDNREHPPFGKYVFGLGQLIFGRGVVGSRIAAATFGIAIGVVLFFLGKSFGGFWAGIVATGLWVVLPRAVGSGFGAIPEHLDRFAMLDVVMSALAIAGIYVGWLWISSGSWGRALGAGFLLGLAVASKEPAAILLPVVAATGLAHRRSMRTLYQGVALGAAGVVAFVLCYVPFGTRAFSAWRYMFRFQSNQYDTGHAIYLAGHVYANAPWWAALWYQWVQNGPWVMTALIVACVAAVVLVHDWRTWYLLAATLTPMLLIMTSPIVLPHYVFDWLPQMLALAAIGIVALFRRAGVASAIGTAVLLVAAVAGIGFLAHLATLQPQGYARLSHVLSRTRRTVVVVDGPAYVVQYYLPNADLVAKFPKGDRKVDALILGHDPRQSARVEQRLISEARARGMHDVRLNDIDVWLRPPAAATAASG